MHDYGIWSVIPPMLTIVLAVVTRQVILSLMLGIILGFLVLNNFHPGNGLAAAAQGLVDVLKSDSSARVLIFILMVGGIIHLARITRGMEGLILLLTERVQLVRGPITTQLLGICLAALIFIESNTSLLTAGIVTQSLGSRYRIAREQLAYIIRNAGLCAWSSVIFNGWGAAMLALISTQISKGFISGSPVTILAHSILYNVYAWATLAFVLISIFTRFSFLGMRKAKARAAAGVELRDGAIPLADEEDPSLKDCQPSAVNLAIPLLVTIAVVPAGLYITGDGTLSKGSGSTAVFWGVLIGQVVSAILYIFIKRILTVDEFFKELLQGYKSMVPMVVIMALAFLIGNIAGDLDVGGYLAGRLDSFMSPSFAAPLIFIMACIISLSTGTSWGTFAIMIPTGIQIATSMGGNPYLAIGAAISGSIFGDGVSPISDTGIMAAMATRNDLMDHVRTQLPYCFAAGFVALAIFIVLGVYDNAALS